VIPPRSALVGQTAYSGMVAESGDLVVLGVQRKGQELAGETKLAVGDTLLLRGSWRALDERLDDPGDARPRAILLGLVVLVFVLGQLISNMATALIVIPIAVSAAGELDVSPKPLLTAVVVSAAAAFLTPVATPANLMVLEPGGYRVGDYLKLGLPLLVLFAAAAVLLIPIFWAF
jgi:di/tricarboxylate transporter